MPRWVIDTNVVFSALAFRTSMIADLRLAWMTGWATPVFCADTIAELIRVVGYPKFKLTQAQGQGILLRILPFANIWPNPLQLASGVICRDLSDQIFLDLAAESGSDALVTGDKDLLALKSLNLTFKIVSPAEALVLAREPR
jgi:uncharacterized protein